MSARTPLTGAALVMMLVAGILSAGCTGAVQPSGNLPEPENLAQETTQTSVYYSTGRTLLEERKIVDAKKAYEETLKELLLAFPESHPDVAIVQPAVTANSVDFKNGVITVDWPAAVLDFEADDAEERIAMAAMLMTFGQFAEVDKVKFTVEGKTSGKASNGKDIETFWGSVSLKAQPSDVMRPPVPREETQTPEATGTP